MPKDEVARREHREKVLDTHFPARRILDLISDKWTPTVLYCLSLGEVRRFNELQRQIPEISKKISRPCAIWNATGWSTAPSINRYRRKRNIG